MDSAVDTKSEAKSSPIVRIPLSLDAKIAYVLSHDLKAPVNHIKSYLKLLDRDLDPSLLNEQVRQDLRAIETSAERLDYWIQALSAFFRVPQKIPESAIQRVSMQESIKLAVRRLQELFLARNVIFECTDLPSVTGDADQLVQLFQYLLHNGIIYNQSDPIWLECFVIEGNEGPIFCLKDNGDGIPLSHQQKIFEPSIRLHSLRDYPGVGMGLSICSRIVEAHQGKIWVESFGVKGEGSVFKFTLGK